MIDDDPILTSAAAEAVAILGQFARLESLGAFAGQDVDEAKQTFLTAASVNFSRREQLMHSSDAGR